MSLERVQQSGPEYLAQRHVLTYMEDALAQLLEHKDDVEQGDVASFFADYFSSVSLGTHALFREFSFVQITPHNRASFLRLFWKCFRTVAKNGGKLLQPKITLRDYFQKTVATSTSLVHLESLRFRREMGGIIVLWRASSCIPRLVGNCANKEFIERLLLENCAHINKPTSLVRLESLSGLNVNPVRVRELLHGGLISNTTPGNPVRPKNFFEGLLSERWVHYNMLDLLSMKEYQCLLQVLCPDFPMDLTQKAARIVLMDDAMDCLMSFSDFLYAIQIQFYYSEFLDSAAAIYQDLLNGKSLNTVIVPTSRSATPRPRQPSADSASLEGVEAPHFYQCLENLCERHKHSTCPPAPIIGEILNGAPRVTFYGFLMALAKHPGINRSIGALPDKGDLLVDEAMDRELDKIVAQLSASSITQAAPFLLPPREIIRVPSPKKSGATRRRPNTESDGSTEETDSSEN